MDAGRKMEERERTREEKMCDREREWRKKEKRGK